MPGTDAPGLTWRNAAGPGPPTPPTGDALVRGPPAELIMCQYADSQAVRRCCNLSTVACSLHRPGDGIVCACGSRFCGYLAEIITARGLHTGQRRAGPPSPEPHRPADPGAEAEPPAAVSLDLDGLARDPTDHAQDQAPTQDEARGGRDRPQRDAPNSPLALEPHPEAGAPSCHSPCPAACKREGPAAGMSPRPESPVGPPGAPPLLGGAGRGAGLRAHAGPGGGPARRTAPGRGSPRSPKPGVPGRPGEGGGRRGAVPGRADERRAPA